jgi:hypothetical protein
VVNAFAQLVVPESYTLTRRIPTPSSPHSLNIFQVPSYQKRKEIFTPHLRVEVLKPRETKRSRHDTIAEESQKM